jgi:hypothetical protein
MDFQVVAVVALQQHLPITQVAVVAAVEPVDLVDMLSYSLALIPFPLIQQEVVELVEEELVHHTLSHPPQHKWEDQDKAESQVHLLRWYGHDIYNRTQLNT